MLVPIKWRCRSQSVRQPLVVTAEHPLEFGRDPGWPGRAVVRPWRTADGYGSRARGVHGEQSLEPVWFRFGVVVEEGDDVSAGEQQPGVARRGLPSGELARGDDDLDGRAGATSAPFLPAPGDHLIVVVHDDDQLLWDDCLIEHRLDRPDDQLPPVQGVGADDNVRARRGRGGRRSRGHQSLGCAVTNDTCVSLTGPNRRRTAPGRHGGVRLRHTAAEPNQMYK